MELFIPSILTLVLAAVVIFLVLPKASPYVLGGLAIALLLVGVVQHYQMFPYEYQNTSLTQTLSDYSPFVILAVLILGLISIIASMFGFQTPSVASVIPAMPNLGVAGSNNSSNKGGVLGAVTNTLGLGGNNRPANKGGVMGAITNTLGLGGNAKKNNGGMMGGILGNRFTTV